MIAEIVSCAVFLAACLAPGFTLRLASSAVVLLVYAKQEYDVLSKKAQEAQVEYETKIGDLRDQISTLEAGLRAAHDQHRAMTAESEGYKAGFHSLKESMHVLSEYTRERVAQNEETITLFNEAQATHTTTINELRQHLAVREAQNRALLRENENYKSGSLYLEGSILTLSEDLANARETVAQHEVEITRFKERNLVLESHVDERDDRIALLSESFDRATSSVIALERKLEQKTKEATDWKDLFERHPDLGVARRYQARQRDSRASDFSNTSELSFPDLLAAQDLEIDQLKVKISECHAQLAMCQCKNLMGPKAAFVAEARFKESMARSEHHDIYSMTD
ncbi:hypothetical protein MD484_g8692, partial [Candolleomyces efflorescens]